MQYRQFYCRNATSDSIEGGSAEPVDRYSSVSTALQILQDPGDFYGIVDDREVTLQFMVEPEGDVWVEVPCPQERGSYGRRISFSEIEPILLSLSGALSKDCIEGLEFISW